MMRTERWPFFIRIGPGPLYLIGNLLAGLDPLIGGGEAIAEVA